MGVYAWRKDSIDPSMHITHQHTSGLRKTVVMILGFTRRRTRCYHGGLCVFWGLYAHPIHACIVLYNPITILVLAHRPPKDSVVQGPVGARVFRARPREASRETGAGAGASKRCERGGVGVPELRDCCTTGINTGKRCESGDIEAPSLRDCCTLVVVLVVMVAVVVSY